MVVCVLSVKCANANGLLLFINPYWMVIGVVYDNVHRFHGWKMAWMPQIQAQSKMVEIARVCFRVAYLCVQWETNLYFPFIVINYTRHEIYFTRLVGFWLNDLGTLCVCVRGKCIWVFAISFGLRCNFIGTVNFGWFEIENFWSKCKHLQRINIQNGFAFLLSLVSMHFVQEQWQPRRVVVLELVLVVLVLISHRLYACLLSTIYKMVFDM